MPLNDKGMVFFGVGGGWMPKKATLNIRLKRKKVRS